MAEINHEEHLMTPAEAFEKLEELKKEADQEDKNAKDEDEP